MTALQGEPLQASQPLEALGLANYVRLHVSRWKTMTALVPTGEGMARVTDVLEGPNGVLSALQVGPMLMSVRGVGEVKMLAMLGEAGVRHSRRQVRALTPMQRRALLDVIRWRS